MSTLLRNLRKLRSRMSYMRRPIYISSIEECNPKIVAFLENWKQFIPHFVETYSLNPVLCKKPSKAKISLIKAIKKDYICTELNTHSKRLRYSAIN